MPAPVDFPMHSVTHITHPCPNCGYCPTCGRSNRVNPFIHAPISIPTVWIDPSPLTTNGTTTTVSPNIGNEIQVFY